MPCKDKLWSQSTPLCMIAEVDMHHFVHQAGANTGAGCFVQCRHRIAVPYAAALQIRIPEGHNRRCQDGETEFVLQLVLTETLHNLLTSTFLCAIWTMSLSGKDLTSTGSSHRTDPQALCVTLKFATRLSSEEPPLRTSMASCASVGEMVNSVLSSFGKSC